MRIGLLAAPVALALAACATSSPTETADNGVYCTPGVAAALPSGHGDRPMPRIGPTKTCDSWNGSNRIARETWGNQGQGALSEPVSP
jgi:hypothetical protein